MFVVIVRDGEQRPFALLVTSHLSSISLLTEGFVKQDSKLCRHRHLGFQFLEQFMHDPPGPTLKHPGNSGVFVQSKHGDLN